MMDKTQITHNLREIKSARQMTIQQLANAMEICTSTVSNHLKFGFSTIDNLLKYSEVLGCTPSDLLDGSYDLENFTLDRDIASFYPFNLALEVMGGKNHDDLYKVYVPELLESIKTLSDREQKVLELRYRNGMNLEQTGHQFNVTRERVRQIEAKAIRKLRHPSRSKHWYLDTIHKAFEIDAERARLERENEELLERLAKYEELPVKEETPRSLVDICDMDLSVRSYNCLKRAGINYVDDLKKYTVEQLMCVRNLGRKSMMEVIEKAKEFGVFVKWEDENEIKSGNENP